MPDPCQQSPRVPRAPQFDMGYRDYSALPWQDRVNPWAGSEVYEAQMRKAYLKHISDENRHLELEKARDRQFERALDRFEAHQASANNGVAGKFFNKDQDKYVPPLSQTR